MRYSIHIAAVTFVLHTILPASAADQRKPTVMELRSACLSEDQAKSDACRGLLASYSMVRVMRAKLDGSKTNPKSIPACDFFETVDPVVDVFLLWSDPNQHPERQSMEAEAGAMQALDWKYPCTPR